MIVATVISSAVIFIAAGVTVIILIICLRCNMKTATGIVTIALRTIKTIFTILGGSIRLVYGKDIVCILCMHYTYTGK